MSRDPIGFSAGDANLYRYVNNSPTNGTDPSGESWLDDYANWFPDLGIGRNIIYPILREAIGDETLAGASDTQIVAGTGVGIAAVGAGIYAGYGGMMLEEAGGILFEHHTGLPLVINPIDIVQRGTKQGAKSFVGFANVPIEKNFVDLTDTRARKHILDGDLTVGGHRWGTGKPGKSEFPLSWSDDKILHAISDIATDPKATMGIPDKKGYVTGVNLIDGVEIKVAYDTKLGRIISGFPINLPRNP